MNTNVETMTAETQKTIEQNVDKMTRSFEDAAAFGQENMEAVVASSRIAAKAAESVGAEMAAFSKKSMQDSMAAAKDLSACKSVSELMEKQTAYTKMMVEGFVGEAAKINDIMTEAAKDAFVPLNNRFSAAVDMMKAYRA